MVFEPFMPHVDVAELESHRALLTGHCYRMLGSAVDAEDAVQETMVRAWRGLERFDGRSSLKTWLYRIATNVCLDALADRSKRARPIDERAPGWVDDPLEALDRSHWLEPVPDARVLPPHADPYELTALRQHTRLAFVAALQHLPPRQRAALILTEVVGWSAAEVASCLETSVAAVNSALQRARATMARREAAGGEPLSERQSLLLERYVDAFHRYDVDALVSLLRDDVAFSMPPFTLWLRGPEAVRLWLLGRGAACRGSRLVRTAACGAPAFAQYKPSPDGGGHSAWALAVLELSGERVASWTSFLDTQTLFPLFDLPLRLPAEQAVV
jgi:RNA polymerase sigma-70 factor, ECF subfamily